MTLAQFIEHFHFLRPEWLLAIVPLALVLWLLWRQKSSAALWQGAISEHLLSHLMDDDAGPRRRWPWLLLLLGWLITTLALAGPSWVKISQPVHLKQDALVIVLDLSLSMLAEDIKPSRLIRARHKILDALAARDEGLTALVAYSGDAHIVTPLTDDHATIANLIPALSPTMMPAFGSDPVSAMALATQLFRNASINEGRILLITDGIIGRDLSAITSMLQDSALQLSILGVGTSDGAPIPARDGLLKDNSGKIIIPQLDRRRLEQLAERNDGRYADSSINNADLRFLLPASLNLSGTSRATEREFDQWHDRGALWVLLLLPLALLSFRRGWLLMLPLYLCFQPQPSYALDWQDLWQRADQQGAAQLQAGDAKAAAQTFDKPQWRGAANYQAGQYEAAASDFAQNNSPDSHYNRANALAKAGQLDEALAAYDQALALQENFDDASFNRQLVEQLKNQEQEQSRDGDDGEPEDNQQQGQPGDQSGQSDQPQGSDGDQNNNQSSNKSSNQSDDDDMPSPPSPDTADQQPAAEDQPQAAEQQQAQQEADDDSSDQQKQASSDEADSEQQNQQQQQAMEQWLRQIPDDPSGLLRRKFNYEHRLRQQQGEISQEQPQW